MIRWTCCLLPLIACAEPAPSDPCAPGGEPTLQIGTGELAYVPLDDVGGELELIYGPQGGYHILIGLQATHLDPSARMEGTMTGTIDGEVVGTAVPWVQMRCNGAVGALQSWGSFLIYDAEPADLDDQPTHIEVELVDAAGTTVTAEADAIIRDPNR